MPFDLSTAKPINTQAAKTGFDLSTAKRFNLSTAKPIEGSVIKEQKPNILGQVSDVVRGAVSGATTYPRGAEQLAQTAGKSLQDVALNKLAETLGLQESLEQSRQQRAGLEQKYGKAENKTLLDLLKYEPQTGAGKFAETAGEFGSALAIPVPGAKIKAAGVLANILKNAGIGAGSVGLLSGLEKAEQGGNIGDIAKSATSGAGFGGALGGGLGVAGAAFEKAQPFVAKGLAGIERKTSEKAIESIKQGKSVFDPKNQIQEADVIAKIDNAYKEAFKPAEYFEGRNKAIRSAYDNSMKNLQQQANTLIGNEGAKLKEGIKKIKEQQNSYESAVNKQNNVFANEIKNSISNADSTYGKQAGFEKTLLDNDPPVPIIDVERIIQGNINKAARGGNINPAGEMAQPVANEFYDMLERGALKTAGYTDDAINDLFAISKRDGLSLKELGVDVDNLTISRNELDVLKQFLQGHKINFNADFKPAAQITKGWASDINAILRENPNYAGANDKLTSLRKFLDKQENSWLNNASSIASKISNADKKSGELIDVIGKVKQLEALLPEGNALGAKLEKLLEKQTNIRESLLARAENAKISSQTAIEQAKSGAVFKAGAKKEQRDKLLEAIKKSQKTQKEETELLTPALMRKPTAITRKDLPTKEALNKLNQLVSPKNKFGDDLEKLLEQEEYKGGLSKWATSYGTGRLLGSLGTLGGAGVGSSFIPGGNTAYLMALLLQSPAVQKKLLQGYGLGAKTSPALLRGSVSLRKDEKNK